MGLLDRWSKKKKQEQLAKTTEEQTSKVVKVEEKATKIDTKKEKKKEEKLATSTVPPKEEKESVLAAKILKKPLVTEKAAVLQSLNQYSFVVHRDANKHQIKQAIWEKYGVMPYQVNVMNIDGKWKRFGRTIGRRSDWRKAVITLPPGKSITIHEGV